MSNHDDPGYSAYRTPLYRYINARAGSDLSPRETFYRQSPR